jgi:hypothetical protein
VVQFGLRFGIALNRNNGFRRVRKIAKGDFYIRYVRPVVRTEQLGSHWTDFDEI